MAQVSTAPAFVQEYQLEPAETNLTFMVEPAGGALSSVKVTESMFPGFVALRLYLMPLAV